MTPGSLAFVEPREGLGELFRSGDLTGAYLRLRGEGKLTTLWSAGNGSRFVSLANGTAVYSCRGPNELNKQVKRVQTTLDEICRDWKLPRLKMERHSTYVQILIDEAADDTTSYEWGLGVGEGHPARWLDRELFATKSVRVDEAKKRVVLSSKRAELVFDRSTGLLFSARARSESTGAETTLTRRSVELEQVEWKERINTILATPDLDPQLRESDRFFRALHVFRGVGLLNECSAGSLSDKRLSEATDRLAQTVFDTPAAREDIAKLVESERALAPSRQAVRKTVENAWLQPGSTLRESASEKNVRVVERHAKEVERVIREFAMKHFDGMWPETGAK